MADTVQCAAVGIFVVQRGGIEDVDFVQALLHDGQQLAIFILRLLALGDVGNNAVQPRRLALPFGDMAPAHLDPSRVAMRAKDAVLP